MVVHEYYFQFKCLLPFLDQLKNEANNRLEVGIRVCKCMRQTTAVVGVLEYL